MSTWDRSRGTRSSSRRKAMDSVGPVVYAARLADGTVKVGHTEHLGDRLRSLKAYTGQEVELLAFQPGTRSDEEAIHASLAPYRAQVDRGSRGVTERSREYYSPTAEVLATVNAMRQGLGLSPLAA